MDNTETKLVDTTVFTTSDAIQAAQNLFSKNQATFEEIKNRPWYKKLLTAIIGGSADRKNVHRSIRDLAQLQELVMSIYITQMQSYDDSLAQVVDQMINTNEVVGKLYKACVLRIKQQPEIQTLSDTDQELLYIFLGLYGKENELTSEQQDRLKTYNRAIANNLMVLPPEVAQDIEVFEKVENADVFYRCAMEQCAVATGILNGDSNAAIEYLNISPRRKKSICTAVEEELSTFGAEHFWMKYQNHNLWEECVVDDSACQECIETEWNVIVEEMKTFEDNCFVSDIFGIFIFDYDMVGFDYSTKSYAVMMAERELRKIYEPMTSKLNLSNSGNLADLAFTQARAWLESGFEDLRNQIRRFGEKTGSTYCSQKMESVIDEEQFYDRIRSLFIKELRENAHQYSLDSFSHYLSLVEIENDDMSIETGFRRILEKLCTTWSYTLDDTLECDYMYVLTQFASAANQIVRRSLNTEVFSKIRQVYYEGC